MNFVIKLTKASFAVLLVLGLFIMPVQAQNILRFKAHISTDAKVLGDLLLTDNPELSALPLDSAPRAHQRIEKEQIIAWIETHKGALSYQWKGKNSAVVQALTQSTGQELLDKAQAALRLDLETKHYESIEIKAKAIPNANTMPASAFEVLLPKHYPPASLVCVKLAYQNSILPIWFSVKAYQKVLVARQNIKAHTASTADDFVLKTRNITGLKSSPIGHLAKNIWLNKSINKHQILTTENLSPMPKVLKGQSVQIKIISEGISISTEAIAQQDGYVGQAVLMKNKSSNKPFNAIVTAANQAEVRA